MKGSSSFSPRWRFCLALEGSHRLSLLHKFVKERPGLMALGGLPPGRGIASKPTSCCYLQEVRLPTLYRGRKCFTVAWATTSSPPASIFGLCSPLPFAGKFLIPRLTVLYLSPCFCWATHSVSI